MAQAPEGSFVVHLDDLPSADSSNIVDEESSTPLELLEGHIKRATLERAIALLPEREADIVTWHYFDDVSFKIIAARLGVSEPRVSQLHSRAMGRLRTKLTHDEDCGAAA